MTEKQLPEDTGCGEATTLAPVEAPGLPATRRALARVDEDVLAHADRIHIEGLEVFARHGVYPEEQALGQKFVISATLYTDVRAAAATDDLGASIDYGEVCHWIDATMRARTYRLIEAAAESLAKGMLERYPLLLAVRIKLEKPWAPVGLPLASVAVEIERAR